MFEKLNENFVEKIKKIYTKEELKVIEAWFSTEKRPVTFRINTIKSNKEEIESVLSENNIDFEKLDYLENWYILKSWIERDLWDLSIFNEWKIYLQWITSQIPVELVDITEDIKVLDLTAAPGWKTTQIAAKMNNTWEIVANELYSIRLAKLEYTIKKQWVTNVRIFKWDANILKDKYVVNYFDIIIADLPCSAEWRINLNREKSYSFLDRPALNKKNYKAQAEILKNSIDLLKIWGQLIYSTCTLDPQENEWIVHFLLSNFKNLEIVDLSNKFNWTDLEKYIKPWIKNYDKYIYRNEIENTIRILPSEITEWFYIAKFIKK